jgi:hypothetical protein
MAYYILIAGSALCSGQDPESAMLLADRAFVQAEATADKAAFEKLSDADFTRTDADAPSAANSKPSRAREQAELKHYLYGDIGDVQENAGRFHVLRVWVKRPSGWKIIVYQEVLSLETPPSFAPGAGKDCENPCKMVPYHPKNETERQVIAAYSKLETAAMAHNSPVFSTMVGDEFVAASSNSNKISDKRGRMADFDHAKMAGVAPTPLVSAQLLDFGDAVLMRSEHKPDRGKPLHVTRIWVKRNGSWVETLSYQTSQKEIK